MKELNKNLFNHIYIEKSVKKEAEKIISKIKNAYIIEIDNYLEIFGRKKQNFNLQKGRQSLILAKKHTKFLYPNPPYCQNFGFERSFYSSLILNCIFDCKYCFLQGMFSSAHIVFFLNIKDFFSELLKEAENGEFLLFLSYDTDLLAFENITDFIKDCCDFFASHKNIKVEIRTKSANFQAIANLTPINNITLAWSILPEKIIKKFENKTPSLKQRITAIQNAIEKGWNVRLIFDPIIITKDYEIEEYISFIKEISSKIDKNAITDIGIGNFRMNPSYLKKIIINNPELNTIKQDKDNYEKILNYIKLTFSTKNVYSII